MHVLEHEDEEHIGNKRATLVGDEGSLQAQQSEARLRAKKIARDRVRLRDPGHPRIWTGTA